ncbi:MAG TPA: ATP-dependent DNA helicase RecQ [Bacillales bacterium]|nr:ATP-dependent DNA helicase RecQ [Bacillales bacterium]
MRLEKVLKEKFHFSSFRKGQKEIIQDLVNGKNVMAMLPTGAGKSICYQLPGYILEGTVLIVSPLLSLMEDQVQQLKSRGEKNVIGLNSFLSFQKRKSALHSLHRYRFIYASPEILQSAEVIHALQKIKISLFVIDEAHCISQWGHEFRTDYLKLDDVKRKLGNPPCLALTATATSKVIEDIIRQLDIPDVAKHIYSIDRPNIAINVQKVDSLDDKIKETIEFVKCLEGPGIIYFSSRIWTEKMAMILRENGMNRVAYYHGGLENDDRLLIQQQFIQDQLDVICCTNAFGMGVDKANVRFIIHFHYPSQIESYLQEIGRAGRNGDLSIAILLYCNEDHDLAKSMVLHDLPNDEEWNLVFTLVSNPKQKLLLHELEALLYERYGISEVKWRFMKYQLETEKLYVNGSINLNLCVDKAKQKIVNTVHQRVRLKQKNLASLKRWIENKDSCRRETLLWKFDQALEAHPESCCDYCKFDIQKYRKTDHTSKNDEFTDWKEELRLIFKQNGERQNG